MPPVGYEVFGKTLFFPKDPLAGGTWIVTDRERFTLCLLNGAFEAHKRTPPYRISRGQMVLEFFKHADVDEFLSSYDFQGIEPFTLVLIDSLEETQVTELIWDGEKPHIKKLDPTKAYIWSSATLYPKAIAEQRASWFSQWLDDHEAYEQADIIGFHKYGGQGDLWNDFVMKRGDNLQTVSITSISKEEQYSMVYEDLLKAEISNN